VAAVNPMLTALTAATATTLGPAVGDAGIAGIGAGGGGVQKQRSGLMRMFSRRSKAQQKMPEHNSGLVPVARVIPVAVMGNSSVAGGSGGGMQATTSASTSAVPASSSVPPAALSNNPSTSASAAAATSTSPQPPLRYSITGPYSDFSARSLHSIAYQGKNYPTAMHLFHAMEFMDRFPETAEAIRQIPQTDLTGVFRVTSRARDEGKGILEWSRDPGVFLPAVSVVVLRWVF